MDNFFGQWLMWAFALNALGGFGETVRRSTRRRLFYIYALDCVLTALLYAVGVSVAPQLADHVKMETERVVRGALDDTARAVLRVLVDTLSPKAS